MVLVGVFVVLGFCLLCLRIAILHLGIVRLGFSRLEGGRFGLVGGLWGYSITRYWAFFVCSLLYSLATSGI